MAKKRGAQVRSSARVPARRQGAADSAPAPRPKVAASAIVVTLAVVLAGTSLAVDTSASAAFDAPKRAIALLGTALAAAIALLALRTGSANSLARWRALSGTRRAALVLAAGALAGAFLSALASPRRALSLDAMRSVVLMAALLPLGASDAVARGRAWLMGVFLSACGVNAAVSILQGLGVYHPFALETAGSRQDTGAFAGNVGYLAIALAFASVAALGILLGARRAAVRVCGVAALALFAADLVVNRNLTALSAAVAGVAALLLARYRRRAALPLIGALTAAGLLVAAYPPLRERARTDWVLLRAGDWNGLVSYRGGPWAAAVEMARDRPIAGFGPGAFPAEYVPHRLSAEIRARRRFLSPMLTTSYGEAHNDYLQAASDGGIPVALLALGAAGCLFAACARTPRMRSDPTSLEPALLLAVLVAGAVAALTWFPLQRPITTVPLLLAAGRAWRVSGEREADSAPDEALA